MRLRLYGHILRRLMNVPVMRCGTMINIHIDQEKGRLKKTLLVTIGPRKINLNIDENIVKDRVQWRRKIHIANPT